jgi:alpha-galactosidase
MQTTRLYSSLAIDTVPETDYPHVRYTSGLFIYDEVFIGGRLVNRYWSSTGGIRPDMHFRWGDWYKNVAPLLPNDAFSLSLEGQDLRGGWKWLGAEESSEPSGFRGEGRPTRHAVVYLEHTRRPVKVAVHTCLDGSPFMIRWLEVTNTGEAPTAISAVSPWSGMVWQHRYSEHTPDGAPSPFELAYNHHFNWGEEGDLWWEPLQAGVKRIDGGHRGRSGWGRPAFLLRNRDNGEMLWVELGWSGNWCMELTTRKDEVKGEAQVSFSIGPDSADPAQRVLDPGETVKSPVVHVALFHDDMDACVQAAHDHVRNVVMPAQLPGLNQRVEANHRGYICDRESPEGIKREIDIAAEIGAEIFVVDAGWYGREPNNWWNNAGDWTSGAWLPNGLEEVSDYAHQKGLLFGAWQEIEAIGAATKLREEHPDWMMTRDGKPVGEGMTFGRVLDLTNPEVVAFMEAEMTRVIRQHNLDLWRIDYNTMIGEAGNRVYQGFVENTLWRYYEALYAMFDRVRAKFPNVIFENCAGGGGRLDWEILRRFQITEISDWLRAPRHLKILNGLSYSLPPEVCLLTFGTEQGGHVLDGNVDFQWRVVAMCHPIFRGISPSMEELSPLFCERVRHAIGLYKDFIRPMLPDCRVYHHTGMLPLFAVTPWCVLEYAAKDQSRGVIGLFRTGDVGDSTYVVHPRGLDRGRTYRVTSDNSGEEMCISGYTLAQDGLRVYLPTTLTSELLLIEAVD